MCQYCGWNAELHLGEVVYKALVATLATRLLRDLGIRGLCLAIKGMLEAAEKSSQWLWMKRQDSCWALK